MEKIKKVSASFVKWFDRLNDFLALLAGGVVVFITLIIIYEVFMRYLVKMPTTWVSDVSEILLVYVTFLGSAYVLRLGEHTRVDIVITLLQRRNQEIMGIIQDTLSLFFCAVFTYIAWNSFWDSIVTQERTAGGLFSVPLWSVYVVIPFGGLLLCIQLIRQIVEHFVFLSYGRHEISSREEG